MSETTFMSMQEAIGALQDELQSRLNSGNSRILADELWYLVADVAPKINRNIDQLPVELLDLLREAESRKQIGKDDQRISSFRLRDVINDIDAISE